MSPFRKAMPSWGSWIRDWILIQPNHEDYVFNMYKEYNKALKAGNYLQIGSNTFSGYVWLLVKLGGLVLIRKQPAQVTADDPTPATYLRSVDSAGIMHNVGMRHYYSIIQGTENDKFWDSPRLRWSEITGKTRG
jgi:hypothetical protein